jgi:hypothetical protein
MTSLDVARCGPAVGARSRPGQDMSTRRLRGGLRSYIISTIIMVARCHHTNCTCVVPLFCLLRQSKTVVLVLKV